MISVEKYLSRLISNFFILKKIDYNQDLSKQILEYIIEHSDINFDNLYVKCNQDQSRLFGFVAAKCTPKKIEFEIYVK